jgi:nucleotide-binding universal stress UspA family protein
MATNVEETTGGRKRKVMIAVDYSMCAEEAFDWYIAHLHQQGSEVICFHSLEPPSISGEQDYQEGKALKFAMEGCKANKDRVEEKFGTKLKELGIEGRIESKLCNKPGEAIVEMAKVEGATMVVLGCRGAGTVRRTVLGSVSDYVLHHAHCPVAICMSNKVQRRRSRSSSISMD